MSSPEAHFVQDISMEDAQKVHDEVKEVIDKYRTTVPTGLVIGLLTMFCMDLNHNARQWVEEQG